MKLQMENLEMAISRKKILECLTTGQEMFERDEALYKIPPWYDSLERAIICLAYGGYVQTIQDFESIKD